MIGKELYVEAETEAGLVVIAAAKGDSLKFVGMMKQIQTFHVSLVDIVFV
jgi:hypothetical protein